jgi:hypothetical protein
MCGCSVEKYVEMAKPQVENFVKLYSNEKFDDIYEMSSEARDKLYTMDSEAIKKSYTIEQQARNKESTKIVLTMFYDLLGKVKSGEISDYNYRLSDPPTFTIIYSAEFEKARGTIGLVFHIENEQLFFEEFEFSSDLLDMDFIIKYREELEKLNQTYPSSENKRNQSE